MSMYTYHHSRRKIYNPHYQKKEGMRFEPRSLYYSIEPEVYIPYFDGNKNVEAYLEWETKVDQIFEKHQLDEYRKFSMATLSFQEYARSWWIQREADVRIGRKSEILNWDELKMCMRRKFVPPSYVKKKKLREEMKELVEKGRNFIYREKEYVRREKEFREKFQALVRKKEENEKKESTKNSFFRVESDIDNILSSLENPCEDVLEEKSMFGAEPNIDINISSTENTEECLIEKEEEEETHKEEESFMTPPESMVEKESLKGDCNTLNSSFQLYNAHSSQKYQKQHFVMLLPSLGNKQHKVNKNIFEMGLMFFFKRNFKEKGTYFCLVFFSFNFLLKRKFISCLFDVYCRLTFDPGGNHQINRGCCH
ncbi:uncharacterized protein [Phaseolus vulgaris]|uniref:uncharacterized protein n=1 Tax=Phaseolus vulgaris TaxID=3885 RepID=UPI0035CAF4A8